jgi:hypothetical protein
VWLLHVGLSTIGDPTQCRGESETSNAALRRIKMWRWLMVMMEVNYNEAYWDYVAYNQWWLKLMMELTDEDRK